MSNNSSSSDESTFDSTEKDPNFEPRYLKNLDNSSGNRLLRSQSKNIKDNSVPKNSIVKTTITGPIKTMAPTPVKLSFETAINMIPIFDGENPQKIYSFLNACEFVIKNMEESIQPIMLEAIQTKLVGNAFMVTQHKDISSWEMLRKTLEESYCATRTPGYLLLELSTTRYRHGETIQQYTSRVEKLLHELCNVSVNGKSSAEAKTINNFIKETALTIFIEGLPNSIRGIIKSRNLPNIEEAIKQSLEEEKMYLSNKDAQRLIQNKQSTSSTGKYCKNCHKNNHNTNECKYSKRNVDTGQRSRPMKESDYKSNQETKQRTCVYCKKSGHVVDECYKKKNADARKSNQNTQSQPSVSGNDKEPGTAGIRPVRELKLIAQNQEY